MSKRQNGPLPPSIKDAKVKALIDALKAGTYVTTACTYAGIGRKTFYQWMDRGRTEAESRDNGNPPDPKEQNYFEIWEAVEAARAAAEVRNIGLIQRAATGGTWQAAAALVERFSARMAPRLGGTPRLLLAGGGATQIATLLEIPARVVADLVLRGLAAYADATAVDGAHG